MDQSRLVVKIGGNEVDDETFLAGLVGSVKELRGAHQPVVVHGGGKEIARLQSDLNLTPKFIEGLRVTDRASLDVAEMVLSGLVNKRLVARLVNAGVPAVGLCGVDFGLIRVEKMIHSAGDLGWVGRIVEVQLESLNRLLDQGLVAVISPISLGRDGHTYNVNADQMASACATGGGCSSLVYLTDVEGVKDENGSVLHDLKESDIAALRSQGIVKGGMLPKTSSCLEALAAGVRDALILPGSKPDILMKFINGTLTEGTHIHGNR